MSNATEPAAYVMQKPKIGQPVIYYHGGTIYPGNADLAYVVAVGETCIDLTHRGIRYEGVRHVDDPRVQGKGRDHRKPGLWRLTDADIETQTKISELEQRLQFVELALIQMGEKPDAEEPKQARKARASSSK